MPGSQECWEEAQEWLHSSTVQPQPGWREAPHELFRNRKCWLSLSLVQVPAQLCPAAHTGHTWAIPNTLLSCWCRNSCEPRCGATLSRAEHWHRVMDRALRQERPRSQLEGCRKDTSKAWINLSGGIFYSRLLKTTFSYCRNPRGLQTGPNRTILPGGAAASPVPPPRSNKSKSWVERFSKAPKGAKEMSHS